MAMPETEARLRENYPTILMTILSLIVALTYESLIASAKEQPLAGLLLALEVVSTGEAACLFLLMPPIAGIGIVSWYSEWKSVVGLSP
ncbi:MAG: hypothetical protein HKP27_12960 [Myxococcales bacterium]|nr:hypothetical protein [Myxococcales bacterium]